MPSRPSDLPDYEHPPVTEVILGVQFNEILGFLTPHLGQVCDLFKSDFPSIEEHAPLDPIFEKISEAPDPVRVQLMMTPPMPRIYLINAKKTELLQVQKDRFIHNWRKTGYDDTYPRFEKMIATFDQGFKKLSAQFEKLGLSQPVANQVEISYVNQIELENGRSFYDIATETFSGFWTGLKQSRTGTVEDANFLFRFLLTDTDGAPFGRLSAHVASAARANRTPILQFTLTARGLLRSASPDGVCDFLRVGHDKIVWAFTELTSATAHKKWGRKS